MRLNLICFGVLESTQRSRSLVIRYKFLPSIHDLLCCGIIYNLLRSAEEIRGLVKAVLSS
jgi:hypothetical protein